MEEKCQKLVNRAHLCSICRKLVPRNFDFPSDLLFPEISYAPPPTKKKEQKQTNKKSNNKKSTNGTCFFEWQEKSTGFDAFSSWKSARTKYVQNVPQKTFPHRFSTEMSQKSSYTNVPLDFSSSL